MLEGARSALTAETVRRSLPARRGEATGAETLVNATSVGGALARRIERDAQTVNAQPPVADALGRGDINTDQAVVVAGADVPDTVRSELCEQAQHQTADQTRRSVLVAEAASRQESDAQRLARQRAARSASMWINPNDGMWHLRAKFDALTGDAINRRFVSAIQRHWRSDKDQPESQRRSVQQRAADALSGLLSSSQNHSETNGPQGYSDANWTAPNSVEMIVITSLDNLRSSQHNPDTDSDTSAVAGAASVTPHTSATQAHNLRSPLGSQGAETTANAGSVTPHTSATQAHDLRVPQEGPGVGVRADSPGVGIRAGSPDAETSPGVSRQSETPAQKLHGSQNSPSAGTVASPSTDASFGASASAGESSIMSRLPATPDRSPRASWNQPRDGVRRSGSGERDDADHSDAAPNPMVGLLSVPAAAAITENATALTTADLRRIACDTRVIPVVMGGASEVLDVGRATRTIPTAIRRALIARDQGCVWPGCDRAAIHCDAHHIQHWVDNGPTSLDNLALLCHSHHQRLHEHNLTLHPPWDSAPHHQSARGQHSFQQDSQPGWSVTPAPARPNPKHSPQLE